MPPRAKSGSTPKKQHPGKDGPPAKRGRPRKIVHDDADDDEIPAVKHVNHKLKPKSPDILEVFDSDDDGNGTPTQRSVNGEAEEDEEEEDQLDPDDSLYPEQTTPSRVLVNNHATPITPPLSTRRSAARTFLERDSPDPSLAPGFEYTSPTKRPKGNAYDTPPVSKTGKGFPKSQQSSKKANPKPSTSIDDDLTFDDISDGEKSKDGNKTVYQEDLTALSVKELPDSCEIACSIDQDSFLVKNGCYKMLPNLKYSYLVAIKESEPKGLVMFSEWRNQIKGLKVKPALQAIVFVSDDNYINPSRISPLKLIGRSLGTFGSRFEVTVNRRDTALCLSPVMVVDSHVQTLNPHLRYSGHYITGIYHSEEWARFGALICMLAHQDSMQIQMWKDAVTFGSKNNNESNASSESVGPGYTVPGLLNPSSSPSKHGCSQPGKAAKGNANGRIISPLAFTDTIPVYDASGKNFEYTADTFNNLSHHFTRYDREIPYGSLAVVCYTCQIYKYGSLWRVTNYAQWVLLLGTPAPQ